MYQALTRLVGPLSVSVAVLAVFPAEAPAQSLACQPINFGDTASALARRLTGRAENRYQPWFRIIDPASSTVVRKARYGEIRPGWRACVPVSRLARRPAAPRRLSVPPQTVIASAAPVIASPSPAPAPVFPPRPPAAPARHRVPLELAYLWCAAAVFGAGVGTGWQKIEQVQAQRRALMREMHGFATLFVSDFERPLALDGPAAPAIRARLRCEPARRRMDILLAPAAGRRYPNLNDHRQNLEYDVERIEHRLRDGRFVRRPLRAEGQWIVIPFQFEPDPKAGAVV